MRRRWITYLISVLSGITFNVATSTVTVPARLHLAVWLGVVGVVLAGLVDLAISARDTAADAGPRVDRLADELAGWAHRRAAAMLPEPQKPIEIPVRYDVAPAGWMDQWPNICRAPAGSSAGPIPLGGRLAEIADRYLAVPSGRLVILGEAGSGKSTLAARLVVDLAAHRRHGDPAPVILTMSDWDTTTDLDVWLAGALAHHFEDLAKRNGTETLAKHLVEAEKVLPVLDGFDEMGPAHRRRAVDALNNRRSDLPFILTSRTGAFKDAVPDKDRRLEGAAVVQLQDLRLDDLAAYLPRTTSTDPSSWDEVLEHLRLHPRSALRKALTTPLLVWLVGTIYRRPETDPTTLLAVERLGRRADIEKHLINRFLHVAYLRSEPGHPDRDPEQALAWLRYLADGDGTDRPAADRTAVEPRRADTVELAWWRIRDRVQAAERGTIGFLAGFALGAPAAGIGALVSRDAGLAGVISMGLCGWIANLQLGGSGPAPSDTGHLLRVGVRKLDAAGVATMFPPVVVVAVTIWQRGLHPWIGVILAAVVLLQVFLGLVFAARRTVDERTVANPPAGLATDRRRTLLTSAALVLVGGLGYALLNVAPQGADFTLIAVPVTSAIAYGIVLHAWGQWIILVRCYLPLRRRLPWDTARFLEESCRRGILRRSGAVYQFRHRRILDCLLEDEPAAPAPVPTGSGR